VKALPLHSAEERRQGRDRFRDLAKQLGFAPVTLGKLNKGGALAQARGRTWDQADLLSDMLIANFRIS
jgi:predicted dinucleotide-binding enzyme